MVSNVASSVKELVCLWTSGGPRVDIRVGAIEEPGGRVTPPPTKHPTTVGCGILDALPWKPFLKNP